MSDENDVEVKTEGVGIRAFFGEVGVMTKHFGKRSPDQKMNDWELLDGTQFSAETGHKVHLRQLIYRVGNDI